ncbi:MAG: AEC family transporter [Candidatus Omnitrophica bacterium]|nr:AEC family transporter [Candidatus Omnitrophota bacterium]
MGLLFLAVTKLSLITLFGFFLYKRKVITDKGLGVLTTLVIYFTVPFLIFSGLVENFQIVLANSVWIFLLISVVIFIAGYLLAAAVSWRKKHQIKNEFISVVSFQNGGYLPMNIAFFLFPPGVREKFLVYIFLYLLGYNILMWSLGSFLIFRKKGERFHYKSIFTPPIISTLVALLFIYSKLAGSMPKIILDPMQLIGNMSFVLSLIILGCWLAKIKPKGISQRLLLIVEASILKLVVMPLLFLIGLLYFKVFSLLGVFVIIEAAMPSAVSLPIIAHLHRADNEFISQGVFFTHILGIITIPLWLGFLQILGFSFL